MLVTRDLSKNFGVSNNLTFPDINLAEGKHAVLLGNSGVGKTTLLHILGGILCPDSGSVMLNGRELTKIEKSSMDVFRGQHIGFVFQKNHLISALSVMENIILAQYLAGTKVDDHVVDDLMRELGIAALSNARVSKISHGQAQRVAIARAMINRPQLILADEPTASLDDRHAQSVIDMLIKQAEKYHANLIIATHDLRVKQMFSHKISLDR